MLQPVFNDLGQFCGVVLRQDLVLPLWHSNSRSMNILLKAVNVCCYINRLIRDGLEEEFNLQQITNDPTTEEKELVDAECQVEEDELEKRELDESDNTIVEILDLLKDHAVSVVTRLKPSKRGYQNLVW